MLPSSLTNGASLDAQSDPPRKSTSWTSVLLISKILFCVQDFATHLVAKGLALGSATVRERAHDVVLKTTPSWSRLNVWLRPFGPL